MVQTNLDIPIKLSDLRHDVLSKKHTGTTCPCCGRYVKLYKRKLTSSMVKALILIYKYFKLNPESWLHVENYLKDQKISAAVRGDFPKLRYWGLLEKQIDKRDDGSGRVGYYKITQKGIDFVKGKVEVPRFAYIYNQKVEQFDKEQTDVKKALGDKFDYEELIGKE